MASNSWSPLTIRTISSMLRPSFFGVLEDRAHDSERIDHDHRSSGHRLGLVCPKHPECQRDRPALVIDDRKLDPDLEMVLELFGSLLEANELCHKTSPTRARRG